MATAATGAFILFVGEEPGPGVVQKLVDAFTRDTGVSLPSGTSLRLIGARPGGTEPSRDLALAVAARLEGNGELPPGSVERLVTNVRMFGGARYVMAGVAPGGTTTPRQQEPPAADRAERPGRQRRSPWAWLTSSRRPAKAEHPVYGLRAGMDRATVIERLGQPSKSTSSDKLFEGMTVIGAKPEGYEYWLYDYVPPGHETRVVIRHGRLESAEIHAGPDAPDPKRVIRIDGSGVHTERK